MVRSKLARRALLPSLALGLSLAAAPSYGHVRITTDLSFANDVRPILRRYCMGCHSPGGSAPSYVDLTTYGDDRAPGARAWAAAIEEEVLTGQMPPWQADARFDHYANTRRMTRDEIAILVAWIEGGAPQGPRRDLPPPPEFEAGAWRLGQPDVVVGPDEEFVLPAGKKADSWSETFTVDVDESTWVTGFEFRPGNSGTVYRMAAWILDPEGAEPEELEVEIQVPYDPFRDENAPEPTRLYQLPPGPHFLGQWVRGDDPVLLPAGMGRRLPKGASIRLDVEYRRRDIDGSGEVNDLSALGMVLAKQPDEVDLILLARELKPDSPDPAPAAGKKRKNKKKAGAPSPNGGAPVRSLVFEEEVRLIGLSPDFGTRVENAEVELTYPDGRQDTLLLVQDYDPAWPASYYFREPLEVPEGSRLSLRGELRAVESAEETDDFAMQALFAVNDHLVLPPPPPTAREAGSRGSMMLLGGDLGKGTPLGAPSAAPADARAAAHMDHSPLHGGQFFMVANQYHHLEGTLPVEGEFRLYVYDDFKQPIDPRNFAGKVVFEKWNEDSEEWLETDYSLEYAEPGAEYLFAKIPPELPAEFYTLVWLAGQEYRFDYYFTELSKELSAETLAKYAALGAHSHVRPPLDIPDSAAGIVKEIRKRVEVLRLLIDGEEWLALHTPAFDARDLAEALLDHVGDLSARQRGDVRQAASRTMQSAADIDRAGDIAAAGAARSAFDRLVGAVSTIAQAFE